MSLPALRVWIDKVGVKLAPGVEPIETKDKGYALHASASYRGEGGSIEDEDEDEDEDLEQIVVTVPSELVLNGQRIWELAQDDPVLREVIAADGLTGTKLLHHGIIYLLYIRKETPWTEYFDTLPKDVSLPFSYSIHDMQGLDFAAVSIHHAALMKRLDIEKDYERFVKSEVGRASGVTLNQWLLPHIWISSRGLTHPLTGETCLVPTIDLCNHSSVHNNVRYDVDSEGNFELRVLPNANISNTELCLDYGNRSTGEFVFNYGFVPDERTGADFDEIFKVFDPTDEEIRNVLDPARVAKDIEDEKREQLALSYDVLLEFFAEELPQVLRIVRLPEAAEPVEKQRYRFHNNFIMALAAFPYLELRADADGENQLFLKDEELSPRTTFEQVLEHGSPAIVSEAKRIVATLCQYFYREVNEVTANDALISRLAQSEAVVYDRYAKLNSSSTL